MGRIHCLARVMVKLAMMTGWKSSIFGYMSSGDNVPLVITTLWNRSEHNKVFLSRMPERYDDDDEIRVFF